MTEQEKIELTNWHELRMVECKYPEEIIKELRASRIKWIKSIKTKTDSRAARPCCPKSEA